MKYSIIEKDLFTVDKSYTLAHCISADYKMGAGVAVIFEKKYNLRSTLNQIGINTYPDCILVNNVFNLVTKERYYYKPTYSSLENALICMREIAMSSDIEKIAMPKIGSGLDKLSWPQVENIIKKVFYDTDIEILVCVI